MAVTMVIGNSQKISESLFSPSNTMASVIANQFSEATSNLHVSSLMEIGFLLLVISIIINIAARILVWKLLRVEGGGRA
jgi:phosphate transport system permease protein